MTSFVYKRCDCDEPRWPKCPHPWYMQKLRYNGKTYAPNLTRHALDVLSVELVTKTDAEALAEKVRAAIRDGSYVSAKTKKNTIPEPSQQSQRATMATAVATFKRDVIEQDSEKNPQTKTGDKLALDRFVAFKVERDGTKYKIGDLPVDAVVVDDAILFRRSPSIAILANSTWAKYRTPLGQFFAWAKDKGYVSSSPFATLAPHAKKALKRGEFAQRRRRVDAAEEAALYKAAGRTRGDDAAALRLQGLIKTAIEAATRHGEALALQWADVHLDRRQLEIKAIEVGARKTGKPRVVPISDALAVELIAIERDPTGKLWPRDAYVFGDASGGRVKSVKKAWAVVVLRAHGFEPEWSGTKLSAKSKAQLARIDLEFKDLRRECALRWYESKLWDILEIRDALGHKSVETTEIYLNVPRTSPADAMRRLDEQRALEQRAAEKQRRRKGLNIVPSVHKVSANGNERPASHAGPRLVKGSKSRGSI